MSTIQRIGPLGIAGVFEGFRWPKGLPDFGTHNLIYGWNGTGKTTLSRVFRSLEQHQVPGQGEVQLLIDGAAVSGTRFPTQSTPVRVFNRDFVSESVLASAGGRFGPIVTVGEVNVARQQRLGQIRSTLQEVDDQLAGLEAVCASAVKRRDDHCTDAARAIKDRLGIQGATRYQNYDRTRYRERADTLRAASGAPASGPILSSEEERHAYDLHRAQPRETVGLIHITRPHAPALLSEIQALLGATVTSAAIEALRSSPELNAWVRGGMALYDRSSGVCPFCDQAMPAERLARLEAHFSEQYGAFVQRLDAMAQRLQQILTGLLEVQLPDALRLYDDAQPAYASARATLSQEIQCAADALERWTKAVVEKRGRVFEPLGTLAEDTAPADPDPKPANTVIGRHNETCAHHEERVAEARESLERHMVASSGAEYARLCRDAAEADEAVRDCKNRQRSLRLEASEVENELRRHRASVARLNADIQTYLGHDDLQFECHDTGYRVTRRGQQAEALSEGETTAVALLYFLQTLEDEGFDRPNGIVMIDDPASSLDANALYRGLGFIRDRTQFVGQLFVLTHNFTVFRETREWFKQVRRHEAAERPDVQPRFYLLDCRANEGVRSARLDKLPKLLHEHDSDYAYLFSLVYRSAQAPDASDLEAAYALPNVARRLLEAFLAFRKPDVPGQLDRKLGAVTTSTEALKATVRVYVQAGSHNWAVGEPAHDLYLLSGAPTGLRSVLELMKAEDPLHFEAMVRLAGGHAPPSGSVVGPASAPAVAPNA